MKKTSLVRRILMAVSTVVMIMVVSIPAFAAENANVYAISNEGVMPIDAEYSSADIPAGGESEFYVYLDSYVGVSRTLRLSAEYSTLPPAGSSITGFTTCIVYKPNGELLGAWNINVNNSYRETFTLPSSGAYRVIVYNDTNITVHIEGQWT